MWDDDWLWVGTWMDEPQLVAKITEKNSVMYKDNDFEVGRFRPDPSALGSDG